DVPDPEHGWGRSCSEFAAPAVLIGPHAAPLGMRLYTGEMFPKKYQNALFLARHGPWNKTKKYAADVLAIVIDDKGKATEVEPFRTGRVGGNRDRGRAAEGLGMRDGSLLASDARNGAIYRITSEK